jgi:hypothetical protein
MGEKKKPNGWPNLVHIVHLGAKKRKQSQITIIPGVMMD